MSQATLTAGMPDRNRSHRELLLSLKYSTIEACFSVPMLNLTLPSFPFVIAFAVVALQWGPFAVGAMAALPHVANLVQPVLMAWLRHFFSLHQILSFSFVLNAGPWGLMGFLPWLRPEYRSPLFATVLCVATLANSIGSVAWSASIAELVPPRIGGKFFGRRNLIFGFWALLTVIIAGMIADQGKNSLPTFGAIFAVAGLSRMVGFLFFTRMRFPESVLQKGDTPPSLREMVAPFQNANYLKLCLFVGVWGLLLNLGLPFYPMFLVESLHQPVGMVSFLTALAGIGGILTLKGWGWLCDKFGSKPVLYVASISWALTGLVAWCLAGERFFWHLAVSYLVIGGATACFQLCQFNLMLKLAPANKAPYVAIFLALTSLLTAIGPLLGSLLLRWIPDDLGIFLGQPIHDFHIVFAGSMVGCLLSTHLIDFIKEEEAHPPEAVWRTMRRMRPFNPLLTLSTTAGMLLTPGGLLGLTRLSVRQLRRHARAIGSVGEDLVEGTADVIRSRLPIDPPNDSRPEDSKDHPKDPPPPEPRRP